MTSAWRSSGLSACSIAADQAACRLCPKYNRASSRECVCADASCVQINARMGGGPVQMINKLVWGVDLIEEQCLASVGIPSRPVLAKRPQVNYTLP